MTDTGTPHAVPPDGFDPTGDRPVGGPVRVAWREGTLTRAKELESLCAWLLSSGEQCPVLPNAVSRHILAAREAAEAAKSTSGRRWSIFRDGPLRERAISNLDAAEAQILNFAPPDYVLGQIPSILRHVHDHLAPGNPQRQEFERIARRLGVKETDRPLVPDADTDPGTAATPGTRRGRWIRPTSTPAAAVELERARSEARRHVVDEERGKIVTAMRAASSEGLREHVRVRSFRNVIVATTVLMATLAVGVALTGWINPTLIPLCFAPEESGTAVVVCPTAQSRPFSTSRTADALPPATSEDIDDAVRATATRQDLLVVELVGLTAAAVSAAASIRGIKGSSERQFLPVALAALKLPTGAITAFLGLLLMRGQFIPGLSALDTSAQILAWALVFGYAQHLLTRLVDRQGQSVLDSVRGANKPKAGDAAA